MTSELAQIVTDLFLRLMQICGEADSQNHQRVMELADEALALCDSRPPDAEGVVSAAEGSIAANAIVAASSTGDRKRALRYAEREWAAAQRNGSPSVRVRALNNRGLAHHELNQLVAAEADYQAALKIVEEHPQEAGSMKGLVLSHLGQLLVTQQREDEGLQMLAQSGVERFQDCPFLGIMDAGISRLNNLASIAVSTGDPAQAERTLREAIARLDDVGDRRIKGILLCNLAEALNRQGREAEAIRTFQEAIELHIGDPGSRVELAIDYVNLAGVYQHSAAGIKAAEIADCYKRAWDAVRESDARSLVALRALWGLATIRMVQKDHTRARSAIERGLDLYEEMRPEIAITENGHMGFLKAYRSLLELGMYLALDGSWPDELQTLIERGKARFTLERLAQTSEKAGFEEIRKLKPVGGMNGLGLNYFVGPNATFVSYWHNESLGGARIDVGEEELGVMVNEFREELLSSSRRAREGTAGLRLSTLLLGKVKFEPEATRYVYYLPDGPLWYTPFEAIPLPEAGTDERRTLGEVAPASYAPSVSVLSALRRAGEETLQRKDWHMAAFGEPQNDENFASLTGTAEELSRLEEFAKGRFQITVKRGSEATREAFLALAPSATHIHVAAHAVADFTSEQPYIVFSGRGEGQFLRSGELAGLKLKAEVAFLSACSTSVGKRSTGEGVMSLARALLWSGCRCVVASLWPMSDDDVPAIVNSFYSALLAGLSPAQAAQLARNQARREGRRAKAWAGIQVLGDGDTWRDRYSLRHLGRNHTT